MKVLLLTNRVPFPANSGYPIVVYNTIKGLVDQGMDVSVFSLNPASINVDINEIDDPLFKKIKFVSVSINAKLTIRELIVNLFTRRSSEITRFYKSASVGKLKTFLRNNKFDIIQIEGLFVMPYINIVRYYSSAKIIYRAHNVEHQTGKVLASAERSPLRRIYLKMLAKRLYRFERENLNKPDAVLTISESDKSYFIYLGCKVPIETFPVAIDPKDYVCDISKQEFPSLFHLGSLDLVTAVESLEWFIRSVWNDLNSLDVGLKFHIAGRNMPEDLQFYESENVRLHDEIEEVKEFMNSKSIMIVPLRKGSGMRVKIIEGMAMRKCIISTSHGAEGVLYEHGKNIFIADTATEFYKYILQCITDRKFCEEIGENARRLVEKDYHITQNIIRLVDFYKKLTSASSR